MSVETIGNSQACQHIAAAVSACCYEHRQPHGALGATLGASLWWFGSSQSTTNWSWVRYYCNECLLAEARP
jgi:hypothetical protein